MELLRSELLRRARGEERGSTTRDQNQNEVLASRRQTIMREMNTSHKFPRRLLLPHLALGRRRVGDEEAALESPKTPVLPSRRSNSPPLYRMSMAARSTTGGLPIIPQPAVLAASDARRVALESMNSEVRDEQPQTVRKDKPKRFLFCLPPIKSRHVRAQLAMCFVAAVFLFSLLAVCKWLSVFFGVARRLKSNLEMLISVTDLGLTLTKHVVIGELNIMLIMIILLAAVFFCYSIIRLWILIVRGDPPDIPRAIDPRGYAVPRNPIRVVMAQDEEAAGVENEAMTMKPPAYGLWRESVVCTGITRDNFYED